jgi:two-component system heavy metal sensor histidine kinase CusS
MSAGLILVVTGFLYSTLGRKLDREDTQFLADKVFVLRSILAKRPGDDAALHEEVDWEGAARRFTKFYVRIRDPGGRVVMESRGIPDPLRAVRFPEPIPANVLPRNSTLVRIGSDGAYRVISALAASGSGGTGRTVLEIALDQTEEESLLKSYRNTMAMALIAGILASAALGYGLTRRGMSPLTRMIASIEGIRFPHHQKHITDDGLPEELVPLIDAFNDMLDRLRESFERLSQFSADLAHELRTPINNLRGEAEVTLLRSRSDKEYRHALESGLEELGRLSRMIDSLLFLARAESDRSILNLTIFEAREEIEKIGNFFEAYVEEKGIRFEIRGSAIVQADRDLFRRAVGNVVENAVKFTPSGGTVILTLRSGSGGVEVAVADTGQGIAPKHLPKVFDRFYRADPARGHSDRGAGLGLSLVRSIMALHGGSVKIESGVGRGTEVLLRFPVAEIPSNMTQLSSFSQEPVRIDRLS